jgi:AcrR family transcriptional regulator
VSEAAVQVFAEQGLDATVGDVAERARVGNATVFRHFTTKVDLVAEVALRWLEDWRGVLEHTLASDPTGTTCRSLITELFERLRQNRLALDLFRAGDIDARVGESRQAVENLLTEALHRAIRDQLVVDDVTYADLTVLVLGTAGRLSDSGDMEPSRWRRLADFTWAAIATHRPGGPTPPR